MQAGQGIVALTGGDERLDAAVSLLENRSGQRLLISGVHPTTTKQELKLLSHGGRRFDCCADLGYAAENTHGNAEEAARWARAHRFKSLIVVTARYHMPRSLTEFQAAMPGVRARSPIRSSRRASTSAPGGTIRARCACCTANMLKYLASMVMNAVTADPALDRRYGRQGSHRVPLMPVRDLPALCDLLSLVRARLGGDLHRAFCPR